MCGIAGFVNRDGRPADGGLLRAMTDAIAHRGPDGDGHYVAGPVALGHRRLAIIDLVTGAQPMGNEDGTVWITYNGEVYNFAALRTELEARGFAFRTTSDTEVILRAWEAFGPDCVERLRGMFAFAIWDARKGVLFLARDRFGIKPLVYTCNDNGVAFASELKALLEDETVARDLDWPALRSYLTWGYVPSPATIFGSIRKLPPASYLLFSPRTGKLSVTRYWDLRFAEGHGRSDAEWIDELRAVLADAVRCHMVADVPVGAFLSGGVDSSSVVALMSRTAARPVRTFSVGFREREYDELPYAAQVAARHRTDHREFVVEPDALAILPRLAWQFDEPFADASALPTYYVSKVAREHVKVALSGDGGDESFAGYRRYLRALGWHRWLDRTPASFGRPLWRRLAHAVPSELRGAGTLRLAADGPLDRYARMMRIPGLMALDDLLTPEACAEVGPDTGAEWFHSFIAGRDQADYLTTLQYIDMQTYLPEDILTKVDRTSMLVSLETRVPLLDHVLVEFVASLPARLRLRDGETKYALKRAVADLLPEPVVQRRKMGFGVPLHRWFRGASEDYIREVLLDDLTRRHNVLDTPSVARVLDEHRSGRRDLSVQIWSLVCLELWWRTWAKAAPSRREPGRPTLTVAAR
jgi:asparagine synthase (glutamine-hydrolysing)